MNTEKLFSLLFSVDALTDFFFIPGFEIVIGDLSTTLHFKSDISLRLIYKISLFRLSFISE